MQQPPYDPHNQPTWQGLPQQSLPSSPGWQPHGPLPQPPKKRHRRWPWIVGILIGVMVLCIVVSVAAANAPTQQAAQLLFVLILFVFSSAYIFQRIAWKLSGSEVTPKEMKRK